MHKNLQKKTLNKTHDYSLWMLNKEWMRKKIFSRGHWKKYTHTRDPPSNPSKPEVNDPNRGKFKKFQNFSF